MTVHSVDSLRKRYLFKLSSACINIPISIAAGAIIARMLGPSSYGNFHFLVYIFTQVTSFFASGNNFLATRLAENLQDHALKRFYWNLMGLALGVMILLLLIISVSGTFTTVFPDQELKYIWMAFAFVTGLFVMGIVQHLIDVYALTVKGELFSIASKASAFLVLLFLYISRYHSLSAIFAYKYLVVLFTVAGWVYIFRQKKIPIYPVKKKVLQYMGAISTRSTTILPHYTPFHYSCYFIAISVDGCCSFLEDPLNRGISAYQIQLVHS